MEIYVIQPGDTLFGISRRYGVSLTAILNLNELSDPEQLVIGQAILIPGPPPRPLQYTIVTGDSLYRLANIFNTSVTRIAQTNNIPNPGLIQTGTILTIPDWFQVSYIVRPEDTLYIIAGRFNVPLNLLIKVNQISNPALIFAGQMLNIPQRPSQIGKPISHTLAYFQLTNPSGLRRSLTAISPYITYGAVFHFPVAVDGSITILNNAAQVVDILKDFNIRPLIVITNWSPTGFDPELARTILSDSAVKAKVIVNVSSLVKQFGSAGINVDFENMYPGDRPLFTNFIRELAAALKPQGFLTVVSVAPKSSNLANAPWVGAFDYAAIGSAADLVFFMTYEWGWIGGPPMAVSPINQVRRVLNYGVSLIPAAKILQGVPFYGYNWPLPHTPDRPATPLNLVNVYPLAYHYHVIINYDLASESPWFRYHDEQGAEHEVWFDDARSIEAKYRLSRNLNLHGVGWWTYLNEPYGFPQNWPLLEDMFKGRLKSN